MAQIKVLLILGLLTFWGEGSPTTRPQPYSAISVQNLDSNAVGNTDEFMDIVFALMPQIQGLVKNVTKNASPASLKEATRFKDIIELFIPFMRKTLEYEAQDEGRKIDPKELEALDTAEFALYYITDLASGNLDLNISSGVEIPDYTDLLLDVPDINIPEVVIPQVEIPSVKIPEINIPGVEKIPERTITFQSIPEVNIPGKTVPVTSSPRIRKVNNGRPVSQKSQVPVTSKPVRITRRPVTVSSNHLPVDVTTRQPPASSAKPLLATTPVWNSNRVSPSSMLRRNLHTGANNDFSSSSSEPEPRTSESKLVARHTTPTDRPHIYYTLPGGGYFYRAVNH